MQFNLIDILILLFIIVVVVQFWRIRAISEQAKVHLTNYCDKNDIQFISIARTKTRIGIQRGKLDWNIEFIFEFSGNGEDRDQGTLYMSGLRLVNIELPAYRIN